MLFLTRLCTMRSNRPFSWLRYFYFLCGGERREEGEAKEKAEKNLSVYLNRSVIEIACASNAAGPGLLV